MNLHKLIFTNNACYRAGRRITPKGIMVHSTGANNPWLKRYVGPDDGLLGKNQYNNHWNQPMDREVCVHAFIGKLADGTVATYQTLYPHFFRDLRGRSHRRRLSGQGLQRGGGSLRVSLWALWSDGAGHHLSLRRPRPGHCVQPRGCAALVAETREEYGHLPCGGQGQAARL